MTHEGNPEPNKDLVLKDNIEVYLAERRQWMGDAIKIFYPDRGRDEEPLDVFPDPDAPTRAEAKDPGLTPDQEISGREVAGRFGIGGEANVPSNAEYDLDEGGKPWKFKAELEMSRNNRRAKAIILMGSPDRLIGEDEQDYMAKFLEDGQEVAKTEYGMVRQIAEQEQGFVPLEQPETVPFGYDIQNNNALVHEPTGQLVKIGTINDVPVLHLRVDRENYFDEEERKDKFRKRPDSAALMGFISDMLTETGDLTSSVGLNTSTTYASRVVDAMRAGLDSGRTFSVGMYGRQALADAKNLVKGEKEEKEVAEPTDIKQIPGELYVMWNKLLELRAAVDEKWPPEA